MPGALKPSNQPILQPLNINSEEKKLLDHAATLFNQQIWCWGRDIQRLEGNWLLEMGFNRIQSPFVSQNIPSIYSLELPNNRCVLLRGFGVFYGDPKYGGIFLPRYEFLPKYSKKWLLETHPWLTTDLPELKLPTDSQKENYMTLVLGLIEWIRTYEENIVEHLGIEYRKNVLDEWDFNKRAKLPAEDIVDEWEKLGIMILEEMPFCFEQKPLDS